LHVGTIREQYFLQVALHLRSQFNVLRGLRRCDELDRIVDGPFDGLSHGDLWRRRHDKLIRLPTSVGENQDNQADSATLRHSHAVTSIHGRGEAYRRSRSESAVFHCRSRRALRGMPGMGTTLVSFMMIAQRFDSEGSRRFDAVKRQP